MDEKKQRMLKNVSLFLDSYATFEYSQYAATRKVVIVYNNKDAMHVLFAQLTLLGIAPKLYKWGSRIYKIEVTGKSNLHKLYSVVRAYISTDTNTKLKALISSYIK